MNANKRDSTTTQLRQPVKGVASGCGAKRQISGIVFGGGLALFCGAEDQGKSFAGQPGASLEGLFGHQFRIDLRRVGERDAMTCIGTLPVDIESPIVPVDYDGDGEDDVAYVISDGGLGAVAPVFVEHTGRTIVFDFSVPVCGGQSTFFFGVSSRAAHIVPVRRIDFLSGDFLERGLEVP